MSKKSGKKKSITNARINEKKATTIIVVAFLIVVFLGGYIAFRFRDNYSNSLQTSVNNQTFTYSSELVTLTSSNVMNKEKGLNSDIRSIRIYNNNPEDVEYRVILKYDEISCTCTEKIPVNHIRYSLDGKTVKSLTEDNQVITSGKIKGLSNKNIEIRLWIDETFEGKEEHYHGRFIVERIEG